MDRRGKRSSPFHRLVRQLIGKVADKFYKRDLYLKQVLYEETSVVPYVRDKLQEKSAFGRTMTVLRSGNNQLLSFELGERT